MNLYYFVFVWVLFMAIFSQKINVVQRDSLHGSDVYRWKFIYALLAFAPVMYIAAFTAPRSDTRLYLINYQAILTSWGNLTEALKSDDSGKGFWIFQWIIKNIFGNNIVPFRVSVMLIHSIPVLYVFRKYSDDFLLSLFLFLATGCHLAWMMNGLRQFMAVAIIMAGTPLIVKRKYIPMIIIILFASTLHISALLMLPIIFIVQGKPWNEKTLFFIVISLIMMYLFYKYAGLLDSMLVDTEYAGLMESAEKMGDDGTNPIRVLVNAVPAILSLIGKPIVEREKDVVVNLCVNMSIITVGIYLISMVTSGIMIGRLPIYTSLYSYILLPHLIKSVFNERSAKIVTTLMIGFYLMYYLYAYRGF